MLQMVGGHIIGCSLSGKNLALLPGPTQFSVTCAKQLKLSGVVETMSKTVSI